MRVRESSRGYWFQILPLKSFLHPILRMPPAFFGVLLSHDLIPMHVAARSAAAEFNHAAFQNGQSIAAERHCRATKSPNTNCQWPILCEISLRLLGNRKNSRFFGIRVKKIPRRN
jgi:hypothetical protein